MDLSDWQQWEIEEPEGTKDTWFDPSTAARWQLHVAEQPFGVKLKPSPLTPGCLAYPTEYANIFALWCPSGTEHKFTANSKLLEKGQTVKALLRTDFRPIWQAAGALKLETSHHQVVQTWRQERGPPAGHDQLGWQHSPYGHQ